MPRRYPGWAESGARLGLAATVRFTPEPSPRGEALVGSLTDTYRVEVTSGPARLVTEGGEETVELNGGGWCIQRPTAGVRNAEGGLVRPEGLLRFWLDCPGGARRRDVVVPPGTRIYCTTGVWDDPDASREAGREYGRVVKELEEIREAALAGRERGREQSALEYLGTFGRLFGQSRRYDSLDQRRREYEQQLPPPQRTAGRERGENRPERFARDQGERHPGLDAGLGVPDPGNLHHVPGRLEAAARGGG